MSTVTIDSPRFGTLEIASEDVIEFPNGLIGLGGSRFALVANDADGAFSWLHSIDDPSLALPVANPWEFFADYAVDLSDEAAAPITADPADVAVWVTVRAGAELVGLLRQPARADPDRRGPGPPGHQRVPGRPRPRPAVPGRRGRRLTSPFRS